MVSIRAGRVLAVASFLLLSTLVPVTAKPGKDKECRVLSQQLREHDQLKLLTSAFDAVKVTEALTSRKAKVTLLAPRDAALAGLLGGSADGLADKLAADPALLATVLYHVLPGRFEAEDLHKYESLPTLLGQPILVQPVSTPQGRRLLGEGKKHHDDKEDVTPVILLGAAGGSVAVDQPETKACKGLLHVLDGVLRPNTTAVSAESLAAAVQELVARLAPGAANKQDEQQSVEERSHRSKELRKADGSAAPDAEDSHSWHQGSHHKPRSLWRRIRCWAKRTWWRLTHPFGPQPPRSPRHWPDAGEGHGPTGAAKDLQDSAAKQGAPGATHPDSSRTNAADSPRGASIKLLRPSQVDSSAVERG